MDSYIYIVLVKAHTGLGNFVRKLSKYEYTHIAVCMTSELDEFITFSRRKHNNPFDSGFMIETLDCYAFGNHKDVKLKVFRVPLDKENKQRIQEYILNIKNDKEYIFNIISMITMPIIHGIKIYKAHNCMSFTSKILDMTYSIKLSKEYYKYSIKDIDKLLSDAGFLFVERNFKREKTENLGYMDNIKLIHKLRDLTGLLVKSIYRLVVKKGDKWNDCKDAVN